MAVNNFCTFESDDREFHHTLLAGSDDPSDEQIVAQHQARVAKFAEDTGKTWTITYIGRTTPLLGWETKVVFEPSKDAPPPMRLLYLAGNYSPYGGIETEQFIERAASVSAMLWDRGFAVLCPHTNTAGFEKRCKVATWDTFMEGDFRMLESCDAVVMLPGWETSKGARAEYEHALNLGIPVWPLEDFLKNGFK